MSSSNSQEQLSKSYHSPEVERKWHARWLERKYFHANPDSKRKPYVMVIPPPNITGILHMGHALNNTLQDITARFKRMQGREVLWLPGTDHAGIATQNVVERSLREKGKDRRDMSREAFIDIVWDWRNRHGSTIVEQLKRLGCSCDWDRLRFTMDEGLTQAVQEVFIRLYDKGLIYRSNYIVNWCPPLQTSLSDEEVVHKELKGNLYHIKYPLKDSSDSMIIATTRPETMLGDTAVGFHPNDKRYQKYRGKTVMLPLLNRELVLIEDESIDPDFGTGCLKITPAHDPNDFRLGKQHNLKFINILNPDGSLNENAQQYKGLDRFEARKRVVRDLKTQGLLVKVEPHVHSVGHCYRTGAVVEPYCSDQWFVKMKPLAKPAIQAVKQNKIRFTPSRWTKVYMEWMDNIRDWCISRQIWWGHRIPIYYGPDGKHVAARNTEEARLKLKLKPNQPIRQDEDVLDTWFSSWLWPFSTLGWPAQTKDLKKFYPTDTLVTGYEIIFFWVARMIMAGYEFIGERPFENIYIHGIVRDVTGTKMSKSLGNVVDPIEIIDEFGTDALRFSMISITSEGQDVFASKERFEIGRNFANKIWNASRFTLLNLKTVEEQKRPKDGWTSVDLWILSRLEGLTQRVTENLEKFNFNAAASLIFEFFWHEFCDWYLELTKRRSDSPVCQWILRRVLDRTFRLLHPFMPFITEELWEKLHSKPSQDSLMVQPWPTTQKADINSKIEAEVNVLISQVQAIRNIRSTWKINPKEQLSVWVKTASKQDEALFKKYEEDIRHLARVGELRVGKVERPSQSVVATVGRIESYVVLKDVVDIDREKTRLSTNLLQLQGHLKSLKKRLDSKQFTSKAPREVVAKETSRYEDLREQESRLEANLAALSGS